MFMYCMLWGQNGKVTFGETEGNLRNGIEKRLKFIMGKNADLKNNLYFG